MPNVVYEKGDKPSSFSPPSKLTTSPELCSTSQTVLSTPLLPRTPPPPPPTSPTVPQAKQYERYSINDDLLKDMSKQLRKPGDGIRKISKRRDMIIPLPAPPLLEKPAVSEKPLYPQVDTISDEMGPGLPSAVHLLSSPSSLLPQETELSKKLPVSQ
jgi:hypothetical protein